MKPTVTLAFDSMAQMMEFFAARQGASVSVSAMTAAPIVATASREDDENEPMNTNAPDRDSRGFPHDERIHAAKKTTNADGTWRRKRNVSDAIVAAVEAELKSGASGAAQVAPVQQFAQPAPQFQAPAPVQQFVQPSPPQQFAQPAPQFQAPAPVQQFAPQPDNAPQSAPAPQFQAPAPVQPVSQSPAVVDFHGFMTTLQRGLQAQTIDQAYIAHLVGRLNAERGAGINAIPDVHNRPELIEYAMGILRAEGRAT